MTYSSIPRRFVRALAAAVLVPALSGAMVLGAAAPAAADHYSSSRISHASLEYGDRSPAVQVVQLKLGVLPATGYFGDITLATVKRYQTSQGIPALGIVGPLTWAALDHKPLPAGYVVSPMSSYRLTATFGQCSSLWSSCHTGLDFAAPTGTDVRAVAAGTIVSSAWAGAYGYRIIVKHRDGTQTWYCHLSKFHRTSGTVSAGTVIADVGATGNVTGPHLHLEVRPGGGSAVSPALWLAAGGVNV